MTTKSPYRTLLERAGENLPDSAYGPPLPPPPRPAGRALLAMAQITVGGAGAPPPRDQEQPHDRSVEDERPRNYGRDLERASLQQSIDDADRQSGRARVLLSELGRIKREFSTFISAYDAGRRATGGGERALRVTIVKSLIRTWIATSRSSAPASACQIAQHLGRGTLRTDTRSPLLRPSAISIRIFCEPIRAIPPWGSSAISIRIFCHHL